MIDYITGAARVLRLSDRLKESEETDPCSLIDRWFFADPAERLAAL